MPLYNAIVSGIGGQGAISVGTVLKKAAINAGIHVSGSERRGGAQREGHVSSMIRYQWAEDGPEPDERHGVCSPIIPSGQAHLLIGLEPLEALRVSRYLNDDSIVIINLFPLAPIAVRLGEAEYPTTDAIYDMFRKLTSHVYGWNLSEIAEGSFGNVHAINAISLGIASRVARLPVSESHLLQTLGQEGRPENLEYFRVGVELANERR
jgi:indolepyruvate ferredoxin oxidoreductase beta subunit